MKPKLSFTLLLPFGCALFLRTFGQARILELRTRHTVREWMFRYNKFPADNQETHTP